jgi:hypothetical protein
MKAVACGKEKIRRHTRKPAQEMHRISTDVKWHAREQKLFGTSSTLEQAAGYFFLPDWGNS